MGSRDGGFNEKVIVRIILGSLSVFWLGFLYPGHDRNSQQAKQAFLFVPFSIANLNQLYFRKWILNVVY